jgi:ribonuclease P protein component
MQRGESRGKGQADLPAEQPAPSPCARLPAADAHPGRSGDRVKPASQEPPLADCLIFNPGVTAVLSARNRMTRSTDFDTTVKHGTRAVQPDLVIYARRGSENGAEAPKVGLIISRSVGSAVRRHQLARRLRHVARRLVDGLEHSEHVVIRALPSSRDVGSARLEEELRAGLRRIETTGSSR